MRAIDVYCRVVDNFGDAGVSWRLARQLASEHRLAVRLMIDQPEVLSRFVPDLELDDPATARPPGHLQVLRWDGEPRMSPEPDVLLCAFGCAPPAVWRRRLAGAPIRPLWVDLEYLSAETWVGEYHRLPSIKPDDGAREWFFFPGFRTGTGGLLRERGLLETRDRFQGRTTTEGGVGSHGAPLAQRWWRDRGLPDGAGLRVSCFAYPDAPLTQLRQAMTLGRAPVTLVLPGGLPVRSPPPASPRGPPPGDPSQTGGADAPPIVQDGGLILNRRPMLPIDDFDRLLWSCDLNLVRGEDSWVRALWAGRPFVWQPYRQAESAHQTKLDAFLRWQRDAMQEDSAGAPAALASLEAFSQAWSAGQPEAVQTLWPVLRDGLPELRGAFEALATRAAEQPDLASQLVEFCDSKL